MDIYVSPVHVLSGIDITITHFFLRLLAKATQVSSETSRFEAQRVLNYGESILYRKSDQIRNTFVKIQSHIRQRQVKKRFQKISPVMDHGKDERNIIQEQPPPPPQDHEQRLDQNIPHPTSHSGSGGDKDSVIEPPTSTYHDTYQAKDISETGDIFKDVVAEPSNDHSSDVKEPIIHHPTLKSSTLCDKKSNTDVLESPMKIPKLKRLKPSTSVSPKPSVVNTPSKECSKVAILSPGTKKISVLHGVIQEKVVLSNPKTINEKSNQNIQEELPLYTKTTPLHEAVEREEMMNRQWIKLLKKQTFILHLSDELKTKENDIILRERRLIHLSNSIRKQQMKLERDQCSRKAEFDEIKQTLFENNVKRRNDQDNYSHERPSSSKKQIEDRIALNPTLTDLRLMLEKKAECMSRREKRLIQIERTLRHENHIGCQMDNHNNHMRKINNRLYD